MNWKFFKERWLSLSCVSHSHLLSIEQWRSPVPTPCLLGDNSSSALLGIYLQCRTSLPWLLYGWTLVFPCTYYGDWQRGGGERKSCATDQTYLRPTSPANTEALPLPHLLIDVCSQNITLAYGNAKEEEVLPTVTIRCHSLFRQSVNKEE